jgi:hypothetical protein
MGETSKNLLNSLSVEKCWALTTKILQSLLVISGSKNLPAILGTEDGFISPVRGWEKHEEVTPKIYREIARKFFPWVEKTFNIPVEDAIGAAKLYIVASTFLIGPEFTTEIIDATKEKTKIRVPTCGWTERFNEQKVPLEFRICYPAHKSWAEEGLKAIKDTNITHKLTKSMGKGDLYCEVIFELREE